MGYSPVVAPIDAGDAGPAAAAAGDGGDDASVAAGEVVDRETSTWWSLASHFVTFDHHRIAPMNDASDTDAEPADVGT